MKIVIDLQCCQTAAQNRGIGRYTTQLTRHIVRLGSEHDFVFLLNYKYLSQSKSIIKDINILGDTGELVYYDYPSLDSSPPEREVRDRIANLLRNNRIETVSPDIYHISSIFEGESVFGAASSWVKLPNKPVITSATLYDFIPYIYPNQYLKDWVNAEWYKRTLGTAKKIDVGLAISEATRADAQKILGLKKDAIFNIGGGVDERFRILARENGGRAKLLDRHSITGPYLLYVGGPDPRKNVDGTLRAFAKLSQSLRNEFKLVIVYDVTDDERRLLYAKAQSLNVRKDLIVTGYVSDDELVELYNYCSLFIFPSLYEGLGLPVIEAMRCGAPVLVGDNSSQREIIDRSEYRFDAASDDDMAEKINQVLASARKLADLRAYSAERAKLFSWENSARAALDAWEEAFVRKQRSNISCFSVRGNGSTLPSNRPRVAMFTPMPPAATGIADYSADFVPQIAQFAELDLFVEDVAAVEARFDGVSVYHHSDIADFSGVHDVIIYQLGNSPFHHYMLQYVSRYPGIVVIHDAYLGHLSHTAGSAGDFVRQVIGDHGGAARGIVLKSASVGDAARKFIAELTCSPSHVHRSYGVIVHSNFAKRTLSATARAVVAPRIAVMPQYVAPIPGHLRNKSTSRKDLGLPPDKTIVATFGHVAATKGILELIDAFKIYNSRRRSEATLILVGELEGWPSPKTEFGRAVAAALEGRSDIIITGYVDERTYNRYLSAIDFGIQLRTVTRGETSRAMLNLLTNEIPFIHNKFGASSELPSDVALGLDSLDLEVLVDALEMITTSSALKTKMVEAQRDYRKNYLDGRNLARKFVETAIELMEYARSCSPNALAAAVARTLHGVPVDRDLPITIAQSYVNQERAEEMPRLLIDVSHIRQHDLRTGVQRVVREVTRAAYTCINRSHIPQTFAFTDSGLLLADDYAYASGSRSKVELPDTSSGCLAIRPFDRMLLADGSWHLSDWMTAPLKTLNLCGGSAFALVHDILPLRRPEFFHNHVAESVRKWLALMAEQCDGLICTSRTAAKDLIDYLKSNADIPVKSGLRVGWAYLGSDPVYEAAGDEVLNEALPVVTGTKNIFLVVGTIEPRKGHSDIIDAFERIWDSGLDATLVFVGKRGWDIDRLAARMDSHPEAGRRFIELGHVGDEDLLTLYRGARATIIGSLAEGFGLPIFEAANLGAPLILSDLEIFRELAGIHARYFVSGSVSDLHSAIRNSILDDNWLKPSRPLRPPSWRDFYEKLVAFMNGADTFYSF